MGDTIAVEKKKAGINVRELIKLLNKALADEWLAYYQYWIGAKIAVGKKRDKVVSELAEHAGDELRHAEMIVDKIIELEGKPLLSPQDWFRHSNCGYAVPSNPDVKRLLQQNIKGEQCAIKFYRKMLELVIGKDKETHDMILGILNDEIEHEEDLQGLLDGMK